MNVRWICFVMAFGATEASAQDSTPPGVRRVMEAAANYGQSLQLDQNVDVVWNTDHVFNAPPAEIQTSIASARQMLSAERARIAALPMPNLRDQNIDLTFVGLQLRDIATSALDNLDAGVGAADSMLAAQAAGDCAALATHTTTMERLRSERRFGLWNATRQVEQFGAAFAGGETPPVPVATQPPPGNADRIVATLVEAVAKSLRCPLLSADVQFDLSVRVQGDGVIQATISNLNRADLQAAIEQRLTTARFPGPARLRNSPIVGRPTAMRWSAHRLEQVS